MSPRPSAVPSRPSWRKEVALIAAFYVVYTAIRDLRGTRPVSASLAFANARKVISLERTLGVFREAQIQHWVLHDRLVVEALDVWYATTHFVVTAAVLIGLFFRHPSAYRPWRNILAFSTAVALVGFAVFPLMPPRLLPSAYGFTDTLKTVGGLWDFDSGPMPHISDQFAAMPSLHFAWALWSGLALFAVARRRWAKIAALAYPAVTLVCVIVTANHYFTDTVAGAGIVAAGYAASAAWSSRRSLRLLTPGPQAPGADLLDPLDP